MRDERYFQQLPKVALHDHLDGALRPATMIELAAEAGHQLPCTDPTELAGWFFDAASSGSLARYLTTFSHTVACMQRPEHLIRVTKEWVEDVTADGVIAAETRWAPEQHQAGGMSLEETVFAVEEGLRQGMASARAAGHPIVARQLICAMRHADRSLEIAKLAVKYRDHLIAGFDIAGGEVGNLPTKHIDAFNYLREHEMPYTIHGGEEGELESMKQAVIDCRAWRIGHGVNVAKDITKNADGSYALGDFARLVRDRQIPLEVCPTSNIQTGVASNIAEHPIGLLLELGFNVTINTDNRLLGQTSTSREYALVAEYFNLPLTTLFESTKRAAQALFLPQTEKDAVLAEIVPAWQAHLDD